MPAFDATDAEVLVFTYKDGLLSAVAHDLKLRVTRFSLQVEGSSVTGAFEASSLKVICAMKEGREAPAALPGFAGAEIEKNIAKAVLSAAEHPLIRFKSNLATDTEVRGLLTLHGVTKEVKGVRLDKAKCRIAEFRLDQRDFGIRPYSAMLGTLKVRPEVLVRISLPKP